MQLNGCVCVLNFMELTAMQLVSMEQHRSYRYDLCVVYELPILIGCAYIQCIKFSSMVVCQQLAI